MIDPAMGQQSIENSLREQFYNRYRVYTVIRLRGRTPDAGSDPPFAPPCKREYTALIAGSDPPFALLLKGRVRPQMRGLTPHFSCV